MKVSPSALLRALATPAALLDRQGYITASSVSFARVIGYANADEAVGKPLRKWLDPTAQAALETAIAHGEIKILVDGLLTSEHAGSQPSMVVIPAEGETLVQLSVPWTPGLRVHAEFPQFVAGVAHEVNNPLAFSLPVVQDLLQQLREERPSTSELMKHLDQVRIGLERIGSVVSDLRSFNVSPDQSGTVDVNQVVVDSVRLAASSATPIVLTWDLGMVPPARGDGRLHQVLLNLLSNATKVLQEHVGDKPGRVLVRTWSDTTGINIQVADNGPGIDPDIVDRVFDPFVSRRVGGTGLGLTVCANLVRAMGGTIGVQSRQGAGTTFHIRLAVDDTRRPQNAQLVSNLSPRTRLELVPQVSDRCPPLGTVLLIDDEPLVRKVIHRALEAEHVVEFSGGNQAIAWLESGHDADVVLCDRVMPDGDGMDVLRWIRRHRREMAARLVFITGATRDQPLLADEVLELQKPFSRAELYRTIHRVLNHSALGAPAAGS